MKTAEFEADTRRWRKEGAVIFPPSLPSCFIRPFSPRFHVWCHAQETSKSAWTCLFLLAGSSPSQCPSYISHHYVEESVQCAATEPAGSVQRRNQSRQIGRKCEWISALHLARFSHFSSLTQSSFFPPVFFFFVFLYFFFFQAWGEKQRDKRSQSCSLGSGSGSCRHQNGLQCQPPGLPKPAPEQLRAGSSVSGGWGCQSAWGALLAGASVAGHRGHGEVLVPLHLSLRNHFFGDWHSRDRCHLRLQRPASDQSGVCGAACHGSSAAAGGHRLLDCAQEKEEEKERGRIV